MMKSIVFFVWCAFMCPYVDGVPRPFNRLPLSEITPPPLDPDADDFATSPLPPSAGLGSPVAENEIDAATISITRRWKKGMTCDIHDLAPEDKPWTVQVTFDKPVRRMRVRNGRRLSVSRDKKVFILRISRENGGFDAIYRPKFKPCVKISGEDIFKCDVSTTTTAATTTTTTTTTTATTTTSTSPSTSSSTQGPGTSPSPSSSRAPPSTTPMPPTTPPSTTPMPPTTTGPVNKRRVCYFTNWSQYRPGSGKYAVANIDAQLCSHIIYSFAKLEASGSSYTLAPTEWNDISVQYPAVMALKNINPNLKVLLAVGGWTHGTVSFEDMASTSAKRAEFISKAISFLNLHSFDGLDYDWEFPEGHKQQFSDLIKETKAAFQSQGLLLSAAVSSAKYIIDQSYDVPVLSQNLDFISLMAYDFHGPWPGQTKTGHNSPLYGRTGESSNDIYYNQDFSVNYWLGLKANPQKMNLGLAVYGRSFTLSDSKVNGMGAPFTGAGTPGQYTGEGGYLSYYEICEKLTSGWTRVWHDEHKAPYAFSGTQWVSYDDAESFTIKAQYIIDKGLGGSMVWSMDLDDFTDSGTFCGNGKYPLLNVLRTALN